MGTVILSETNELPTIKISELIEAGSFQDDDVLPGVTVGQTRKVRKSNLMKNTILSSGAYIIHVAKNGDDGNTGTIGDPFLTINAANNYFIANKPPYPVRGVIRVAPGIYEEQIEDAFYRIYLVGDTKQSDEKLKAVTIYNTGADEAHCPLATTISDTLNLIGINVETDAGGVLGEMKTYNFDHCNFVGGHFVENTDDYYAVFTFCVGRDLFDLQGITTGTSRTIKLSHCDIYGGDAILNSSGSGTHTLKLAHSMLGSLLTIAGDWSLSNMWSEMYLDATLTFNTNGYLDINNSILCNNLHFVKDTSGDKKFVNNYFRNTIPGQTDITVEPGVAISIVDYSGNKQENGLPAAFQIAGGGRNVGGFAENKYCSLQCAVESIPDNETGTIEIFENQTALDELVLNAGSMVTIKCGKKYNLEFTGDIVTLTANQELSLHEVAFMGGQKMEIAGDGALLSFEGCLTAQGYIVATSGVGSMVLSYFSSLVGVTGFPIISIDNEDTLIVSGYSRLKGATGQPAVLFNVLTANMFKVKYTTLIHGSGLGNRPIEAGFITGKADVSLYNSAMNASLDTSRFNNLISSPNLTTSSEIDY